MTEDNELAGVCMTCWECDGTGVSKCTAIKPCPCFTCGRRKSGQTPQTGPNENPFSIWYDKRGAER